MATAKRPVVIRINANVPWLVGRARKGQGQWIAICDPLSLTLQAETWANLMEDIALTLDAMMKELLSTNDLDRFMREHGWKFEGPKPKRPENVKFDLPFSTKQASPHDLQRYLH